MVPRYDVKTVWDPWNLSFICTGEKDKIKRMFRSFKQLYHCVNMFIMGTRETNHVWDYVKVLFFLNNWTWKRNYTIPLNKLNIQSIDITRYVSKIHMFKLEDHNL